MKLLALKGVNSKYQSAFMAAYKFTRQLRPKFVRTYKPGRKIICSRLFPVWCLSPLAESWERLLIDSGCYNYIDRIVLVGFNEEYQTSRVSWVDVLFEQLHVTWEEAVENAHSQYCEVASTQVYVLTEIDQTKWATPPACLEFYAKEYGCGIASPIPLTTD